MNEQQKVELIFDANKITEKVDNEANYQLFQINDFFVEAKTSLEGKFKRSFTTYSLKELPVEYAGEVLSIPIVILNDQSEVNDLRKSNLKNKKGIYSKVK
ncbi:MAG: hypothetical protein WKG06_07650 [Segetibacter sp.]